jgi:hypothetical protein
MCGGATISIGAQAAIAAPQSGARMGLRGGLVAEDGFEPPTHGL